jgi:hypothetical protein
MIIPVLIFVLVAGWTAAWLHWFFAGDLRHFLFAYVFPSPWRAGRSPAEITTLSHDEFEMFLAAESDAPGFVRGVLGCPGCLSAHIAAVGTVLGVIGFFHPLFLVPLAWASAAWVGHRLHHHL